MSDLQPRRAARAMRRRRLLLGIGGGVLALALAAGAAGFAIAAAAGGNAGAAPGPEPSARTIPPSPPGPSPVTASPTPSPTPTGFDRSARSTTDPASPWFVVNKIHPIPGAEDYVPELAAIPGDIPNPNGHRLHPDAAVALVEMSSAAAAEADVTLIAQSGYRSYSSQVSAFGHYVDLLGVDAAERTSARPGFSEHQTGFAVDLCTTDYCDLETPAFGRTTGGEWLAANAWRFGFILRYPEDKVEVTGYEYEPWHFRYVGSDLSTAMHEEGVTTLEEFFGIPGSTRYR